ncbi:MAG: ATP-binding protein, partial [Acidimicrobiia bacterium]
WTEIMHAAFELMIEPITRLGGSVTRLMGDGLLALFGAPVAHEDDPERAVLAGLEMLVGLEPLRRDLSGRGLEFNIRVGLNTGLAVVGEIGPAGSGEYTAMGDAVNLAARMEQTAVAGSLQVTEATYHAVRHRVEAEALGPIEVKGKDFPVSAYRIKRVLPAGSPPIEAGPLVGRDDAMTKLGGALEALHRGIGGVVVLVGEAGLGKTRLIAELQRMAEDTIGTEFWLESRGVSYDSVRPMALIMQRIHQLYGLEAGATPDEIRRAVGPMHESRPKIVDDMVETIGAGLTARDAGDDTVLGGAALKQRSMEVLLGSISAYAERSPLVLVFDDLQWADSVSIEMIEHALSSVDSMPVLFVCGLRPDPGSGGWRLKQFAESEFPHRYEEIVLEPLNLQASTELLDALHGPDDGPVNAILEAAAGNPLYLEELSASPVDAGMLSTGLQSLITARVDQLEPGDKAVLQAASVLGRSFRPEVLQRLVATTDDLTGSLGRLVRARFLTEVARIPAPEFAFRHELVRQAAYESLLKRDRRVAHSLAAEAILSETADGALVPHLLAHHFREAGDSGPALKWSIRAGDEALRLSAWDEARSQYRWAEELLEPAGATEEEAQLVADGLLRSAGRQS